MQSAVVEGSDPSQVSLSGSLRRMFDALQIQLHAKRFVDDATLFAPPSFEARTLHCTAHFLHCAVRTCSIMLEHVDLHAWIYTHPKTQTHIQGIQGRRAHAFRTFKDDDAHSHFEHSMMARTAHSRTLISGFSSCSCFCPCLFAYVCMH